MASGSRTASTLASFDDSSEISPAGSVAMPESLRQAGMSACCRGRICGSYRLQKKTNVSQGRAKGLPIPAPTSQQALTFDRVQAATARLAGIVHRTPLLTSRTLDARCGGTVCLKAEPFQRSGSFKFRGAYYHVMAGQGSAGVELAEQAGELDLVLVPVGGGGLAAGVGTAIKAMLPGAAMIGVEPAGADDTSRALRAGHRGR